MADLTLKINTYLVQLELNLPLSVSVLVIHLLCHF